MNCCFKIIDFEILSVVCSNIHPHSCDYSLSVLHIYFQSVVLISRLPFVALFSQLVSIIAPEYFDNGEPSLEAGMVMIVFFL